MSTRGSINFVDDDNKTICNIYSHHDSYPQEPGRAWDIYRFFARRGHKLGADIRDPYLNYSNGIEDAAAQFLYFLKKDAPWGSVYLYPPITPELNGNGGDWAGYARKHTDWEYLYIISENGVIIWNTWKNCGKEPAYDGPFNGLAEKFGYKDTETLADLADQQAYERYAMTEMALHIQPEEIRALEMDYAVHYCKGSLLDFAAEDGILAQAGIKPGGVWLEEVASPK